MTPELENKPVRVDLVCGKNRLSIIVEDQTDLDILKAWFENTISKAARNISTKQAQPIEEQTENSFVDGL